MEYNVVIEKGHSKINDEIIAYLKDKIGSTEFLDIGCNTGFLLDECPQGHGCDLSSVMTDLAVKKGHIVIQADANNLPYEDNSFPVCVLSCVLEQTDTPYKALEEAIRVASQKVYGVFPMESKSPWGIVGGTTWVKSVLDEVTLIEKYGAKVIPINDTHAFFEIATCS